MRVVVVAGLLLLALLPARAAAPAPAPSRDLRVLVLSAGLQPVLVRGVWTVDGTARLVAPGFTPLEFTARAGATVSGYFEVVGRERGELRIRVFDPASPRLNAEARSSSLAAARVAWAPDGAGPRCVDRAKARCPDTVPGREAMLALQQEAPVPVAPAPRDVHGELVERLRSEPPPRPDDPAFPPLGIVGTRTGSGWAFGPAITDPMRPDTLDEHFAWWHVAARVSLLLQYARLATEPDTPPVPEGAPAERAEERARIRRLLQDRPYEEAWRPFLEPYRGFRDAVAQVRPGREGVDDSPETWKAVDRIARDRGLYRFVVELPIEPADVADEILRLADRGRRP